MWFELLYVKLKIQYYHTWHKYRWVEVGLLKTMNIVYSLMEGSKEVGKCSIVNWEFKKNNINNKKEKDT